MSIAQMFFMGSGEGLGPHWISRLSSSKLIVGGKNIVSPTGKLYISGQTTQSTSSSAALSAGYDSNGSLLWQKSLGGLSSTTLSRGYGIATDSLDNVFLCGTTQDSSSFANQLLAKYNSSGVLQWQKTLGVGSVDDINWDVSSDSSGNIYAVGFGENGAQIIKYNTSGTRLWGRNFASGAGSFRSFGAVDFDPSGNVYVSGTVISNSPYYTYTLIVKYDTNGDLLWQRIMSETATSFFNRNTQFDIAVDDLGNSYTISSGTGGALIFKHDTNGNFLWQRSIDITFHGAIDVDGVGNSYITGYYSLSGYYTPLIAKYDTNGNLLWQRTLRATNGTSYWETSGISILSGNYYVEITDQPNAFILLAKLPGDGSKTGTYGSTIYEVANRTTGTPSYINSISSYTSSTSTLSEATSSLLDTTTNLSSSTVSV